MDQSHGQNDRDQNDRDWNDRDRNDRDEDESDRDHVQQGDVLLSYLTPAHCLHRTTMQEVQSCGIGNHRLANYLSICMDEKWERIVFEQFVFKWNDKKGLHTLCKNEGFHYSRPYLFSTTTFLCKLLDTLAFRYNAIHFSIFFVDW